MMAFYASLRRMGYFRQVGELLPRADDVRELLAQTGVPLDRLPALGELAPGPWWERAGEVICRLEDDPEAILRLVAGLYRLAPGVYGLAAALDEARGLVRQGFLLDPSAVLEQALERRPGALIGPLDLRDPAGRWLLGLAPGPPDTPLARVILGRTADEAPPGVSLRLSRPGPSGTPTALPQAETLEQAGIRSGDVMLARPDATAAEEGTTPADPRPLDVAALTPGAVLAGRYRITPRGLIDATRYSEVYQAEDLDAGGRVALKLLRPGLRHHDERALDILRLPGVVRKIASFEFNGQRVIVTAWVDGSPFPTGAPPWAWSELLPLARRVLEVLRDVHAHEIVHRDLKPGNVLVGPGGAPTLIDFGVSMRDRAGLRDADSATTPGTLAYVAPELRSGLSEASPASDLFALGVMLWRALTGQHPYPILERGGYGLTLDEPRWPEEIPCPPEPVLVWLRRLLAPDRALRPASGAAALRDLLEATRARQGAPPSDEDELRRRLPRWDPEARLAPSDLEELFDAEDRLRRLRTRAAAQLHRRAGDAPGAVRAELLRWLRAGLIELRPCGLGVDQGAVSRLEGVGLRDDALASIRDLPGDLGLPAATVLFWVSLAGPDLRPSSLRRCADLDEDTWSRGLDELLARGCCALDGEGGVRDQTGGAGLYLYDLEERRQAHEIVGPLLDQASPRRLYHLTQAGLLDEAVETAIFQAEGALRRGHLHEAVHLLGLAAQWSQGVEDAQMPALLRRLTLLALQTEDLNIQRTTLRRVREHPRAAPALSRLLEASVLALSGSAGASAQLLRRLDPLADAELEGWRLSLGFQASARLVRSPGAPDPQNLLAFAQRVGDREAEARAWLEFGWSHYRQDRPAEAARAFERALNLREHPFTRLATLVALGSALLDADRGDDAAACLRDALRMAHEQDNGFFAARAAWLLRRVDYQAERATRVDDALIRALVALAEPTCLGLGLVTEAAIAWRAGQRLVALLYARRGAQLLDATGATVMAVLGWALALHLGEPTTDPERRALIRRARRTGMPGVALQVLALAGTTPPLRAHSRRAGRAALIELSLLPEDVHLQRRQELLSPLEAGRMLNLDVATSQPPGDGPSPG